MSSGMELSGKVGWRSPSNIALIKYWGKTAVQIPSNPSLSFTLQEAHTDSYLHYYKADETAGNQVEVFLDGDRKKDFEPKILAFLERIKDRFDFLDQYNFKLETSNSFPHSSGIASSASGMSALALCLCTIEANQKGLALNEVFYRKASDIARLGSGSACRSIYGGLVMWGEDEHFKESSNLYGIPLPGKIDPVFENFRDTILLVEEGEKEVSSTLGHSLMDNNPFSDRRFEMAHFQLNKLVGALQSGDLNAFGKIVEQEALMLHAMMMTSDPYFLLFKPNSLQIIEKVWSKRNQNQIQMYITMDAGANIHLLYPEFEEQKVMKFVEDELIVYCKNKRYICDRVGSGPTQLLMR